MSSGDVEAGERLAFCCCFPEGSGEKPFGAGGGLPGRTRFSGPSLLAGGLRQEQTPEEGEGNADRISPPQALEEKELGQTASQEAVLLGREGTGEVANKM